MDGRYPPIPTSTIEKLSSEFGISGFGLNTSHWSVKNGDLFEMIARFPSKSIAGYLELEEIGQGASGVVVRAIRTSGGFTFQHAIKKFKPSPFISDQNIAKERFVREIRTLLEIKHHSVVAITDSGTDSDGIPFYVMPYIEGDDLRTAMTKMDFLRRLQVFDTILSGIEYAHSKQIYHRDLKPSNIKVRNSDGHPQILDFGNAYMWEYIDEKSITFSVLGSPGYIPYEAINNPKMRSPHHDIFSLGVILYEVFFGAKPSTPYRSLNEIGPYLAQLDSVIQRAIAPLEHRFSTISEFRNSIRNAFPAGW